MLRLSRKLKVIGAASALLVVMLAAGVAHGGILWSGIDPEIRVGDHTVNIWTEWPSQYDCDVEDIKIRVRVPGDAHVQFMGESTGSYDCGDSGVNIVETSTRIKETRGNFMQVAGKLRASEDFPVRFKVYLDGELLMTCDGESNRNIKCEKFRIGGLDASDFGFDFLEEGEFGSRFDD